MPSEWQKCCHERGKKDAKVINTFTKIADVALEDIISMIEDEVQLFRCRIFLATRSNFLGQRTFVQLFFHVALVKSSSAEQSTNVQKGQFSRFLFFEKRERELQCEQVRIRTFLDFFAAISFGGVFLSQSSKKPCANSKSVPGSKSSGQKPSRKSLLMSRN